MDNPNLNRAGRKPLFTPQKAFELLEARKMFSSELTVQNFIHEMVAAEVIPKPCSTGSMHRLLTGKMFPSLCVYLNGEPTRERYKYELVPKAPRGFPAREGSRDVETGEPKRPMTKIRQWLQEDTIEKIKPIIYSESQILEDRMKTFIVELVDRAVENALRGKLPEHKVEFVKIRPAVMSPILCSTDVLECRIPNNPHPHAPS